MGDRARGANADGLRAQVKASLARWVLHKRRDLLSAGHQRPAPHDEATHAWDGRRRFAEDYLFAAVQHDLGLLVRLEWLPGRGAHRVWLMLLSATGAWWIPPEHTIVAPAGVDRWQVAGLTLDCVQPLLRWTVRYQGPLRTAAGGPHTRRCDLNLAFDAIGEPFVPGVDDDPELIARRLGEAQWDPGLLRAVRRASQRGYVQVGRLGGTAALGSDVLRVDALGIRQHSWGVRDWGAPDRALQGMIVEGESVTWVQQVEFPAFTLEGGFVATPPGWRALTNVHRASRDGSDCALAVETTAGSSEWSLRGLSDASLRVDGRGAFDLAFVSGSDGVRGLWATQRRTLPRVDSPR